MQELKMYYRAFREYQEKMKGDGAHDALLKALLADREGSEGFQLHQSQCVWDAQWIDAMMDAMPYVERALAEQRKFIVSHEEIRRIDQARRTSVESVRHLAQHSNMISKVEGEDVIPDRVLIVERDDNYFIYENRFLYTLVHRMNAFLEERLRAVAEINESTGHRFSMRRSASWNRSHLEAELHLHYFRRPERVRSDVEIGEMTSAERVRHLHRRVSDCMNAPLMRTLKGATPVSSPIVRTNVFKKNSNFKRALELYEFLENYRHAGYEIITEAPQEEELDAEFRRELCETLALENFIGRMNADPALKAALEADFYKENARREQERIRQEEEREREVLRRIEEARAEEIAIREAELAKRDAVIRRQEDALQEKNAEIGALNERIAAVIAEGEARVAELQNGHAARVNALEAEHAAAFQRMQDAHAQNLSRCEGEISRMRIEGEARLDAQRRQLQVERDAQLDLLRSRMQEQANRREKYWQDRLSGLKAEQGRILEKALARQRREEETRLRALKLELKRANAQLAKYAASESEEGGTAAAKFRRLLRR